MGAFFINFDRAQKFDVSISDDKRNPDLRVLNVKGFDTLGLTFTPDQLRQIGDAIAKETGGNTPF